MHTNACGKLVRADTGQGIKGKTVYKRGTAPTYPDTPMTTGSYGEITTGQCDIDVPSTPGRYNVYFEFLGDLEYEPCKSEEVWITVDPNLIYTYAKEEATPLSGDAPLTVKVSGYITPQETVGLPIHLVVLDPKSEKYAEIVDTVVIKADGYLPSGAHVPTAYEFTHTFTRPGTYVVYTVFRGNETFASCRGAVPQTITVGGVLPKHRLTIDARIF
jgi:hypothetical protein